MRNLVTPEQAREDEERLMRGIRTIVNNCDRLDSSNIEELLGVGLGSEDEGIEEALAFNFGLDVNHIWNAVEDLRDQGEISYGIRQGGPAHDPRRVLVHISIAD